MLILSEIQLWWTKKNDFVIDTSNIVHHFQTKFQSFKWNWLGLTRITLCKYSKLGPRPVTWPVTWSGKLFRRWWLERSGPTPKSFDCISESWKAQNRPCRSSMLHTILSPPLSSIHLLVDQMQWTRMMKKARTRHCWSLEKKLLPMVGTFCCVSVPYVWWLGMVQCCVGVDLLRAAD